MDSLMENLHQLQQEGAFCDTCLHGEDNHEQVHGAVLVARCPQLKLKLLASRGQDPHGAKFMLLLKPSTDLQAVVRSIYLSGDDLASFVSEALFEDPGSSEADASCQNESVPNINCPLNASVPPLPSPEMQAEIDVKETCETLEGCEQPASPVDDQQHLSGFLDQKTNGRYGSNGASENQGSRDNHPWTCRCGKAFSKQVFYHRHKKRCRADADEVDASHVHVRCSICRIGFRTRQELRQHISTEHRSARKHQCDLCDWSYKSQPLLWMHKKRCHGLPLDASPLTVYRCQLKDCSYETLQKSSLQLHCKTTHASSPSNLCHFCGYGFKTKYGLSKHARCCPSVPQVPCRRCGQLLDKDELKHHLEEVHGNLAETTVNRLMCSLCPYTAKQPHSLHLHNWKEHQIEPPSKLKRYECRFCDFKVLSRKSAYDDHMRLHLGVMPHECKVCGKSFNSKPRLQNHLKHHQDKKHKCDVCGRAFAHKCNLKTHMKSVHTEKGCGQAWKCVVCDYSAKLKFNLKAHMKNVHQLDSVPTHKRVERIVKSEIPDLERTTNSADVTGDGTP